MLNAPSPAEKVIIASSSFHTPFWNFSEICTCKEFVGSLEEGRHVGSSEPHVKRLAESLKLSIWRRCNCLEKNHHSSDIAIIVQMLDQKGQDPSECCKDTSINVSIVFASVPCPFPILTSCCQLLKTKMRQLNVRPQSSPLSLNQPPNDVVDKHVKQHDVKQPPKGAIAELLNLMSKGWQNRFNFQFDSAIVWKRIIVPQTLPLP